MRQTIFRLLTALAIASSTLVFAQCGGGGETNPAAPSSPSPSGSGGGTPTPAPTSPGNSLSLNPSSIQGQGQPQGLVTLASAAPGGGTLVSLTSSNPGVAKVPATVTVAAGSRTAAFLVDTASVPVATSVTITASYSGISMSSNLTVTSTPLAASFSVNSPEYGADGCGLQESLSQLDCILDGSSSSGNIVAWIWTYTAGTATLGHTSNDAGTRPQISTKCAFFNTASGGDDPDGSKYLKMEVSLQVEDRSGARSGIARRQVRVYPNKRCGFSY